MPAAAPPNVTIRNAARDATTRLRNLLHKFGGMLDIFLSVPHIGAIAMELSHQIHPTWRNKLGPWRQATDGMATYRSAKFRGGRNEEAQCSKIAHKSAQRKRAC